jgi:HAD superfamily hydrolase (TIGR01509 family)
MGTAIFDRFSAVLLDVDGTLVDSNDAHAHAWIRAFREHGVDVDPAEVRTCIGMGADKLMPRAADVYADTPDGERISRRRKEIFLTECLPVVKPFPGARELVVWFKANSLTVVVASSATEDELKPLLELAGVHDLIDGRTSSDDARESKPDPDILCAALRKAGAEAGDAVMIGDTPYDIGAAAAAGVAAIAFRTGGWPDAMLADTLAIYDGPWQLLAALRKRAA